MRFSMALGILALATASFGQTIERRFEVRGKPTISVKNEDGRTEIVSHTASQVSVRATKEVVGGGNNEDDRQRLLDQVQVRIEQHGDRIEIETIHPTHQSSFRREGHVDVHLEIRAPRRADLDVTTEDGPLTVEGFEGDLHLTVEDGDLRVADCAGTISAEGEDGDIDLIGVSGAVRAHLEDGDLEITGALSRLTAETEDGDIGIELSPDSSMAGDWSIDTEDGTVRLRIPDSFAAKLEVRVSDGSIQFDRPVTVEGKLSRQRLSTELGGGGHHLRIRTDDGSVRISES